MISAEEVVSIYQRLSNRGIQLWVIGGWGIDALLGEQTRPHKDLDVLMLVDDVVRTRQFLRSDGYSLKELWSENCWTTDAQRNKVATAFVLRDAEGHELDAHAVRLDNEGNGIPAWTVDKGIIFSQQDLDGIGTIAGLTVRCITPEAQMRFHVDYALPEKHQRDLERLHERFGAAYPDEITDNA